GDPWVVPSIDEAEGGVFRVLDARRAGAGGGGGLAAIAAGVGRCPVNRSVVGDQQGWEALGLVLADIQNADRQRDIAETSGIEGGIGKAPELAAVRCRARAHLIDGPVRRD